MISAHWIPDFVAFAGHRFPQPVDESGLHHLDNDRTVCCLCGAFDLEANIRLRGVFVGLGSGESHS
jgi:hypothetical protein